eukprot:10506790-Alexandrium_andersonii.AAC.1
MQHPAAVRFLPVRADESAPLDVGWGRLGTTLVGTSVLLGADSWKRCLGTRKRQQGCKLVHVVG